MCNNSSISDDLTLIVDIIMRQRQDSPPTSKITDLEIGKASKRHLHPLAASTSTLKSNPFFLSISILSITVNSSEALKSSGFGLKIIIINIYISF